MDIAIVGYGKMGKEVETVLLERGHRVAERYTSDNPLTASNLPKADVVIEFTSPDQVIGNIQLCLEEGIPIVTGTTGWQHQLGSVEMNCREMDGSLFYASNFSLGINLFLEMSKQLTSLMDTYPEYTPSIEESHHIHKLDAPSGTAISLANAVLPFIKSRNSWTSDAENEDDKIRVTSFREGEVIGTHSLTFDSAIDSIKLTHAAKNRKGFALGAVLAAEWLPGKTGVFTMKDLLKL